MGTTNKVKFLDEHKEHYLSENVALKSKLQSKVEALAIISLELDKCRSERDQFKLMAEQLQERYSVLKKKSYCSGMINNYNEENRIDYSQTHNVAELLSDTRELNKSLILEVEKLRQKLSEAEGDMCVLRKQLKHDRCSSNHSIEIFPAHQREELVEQLEKCQSKMTQLQSDLQSMLDDKEELILERDAFKCKVHRLNHELSVLLKSENMLLDGDALITENRYLHERLQQSEAETQLASQALAKYKSMLESKRQKGAIKLGNNNTDMIMSHKQVKRLLEEGTSAELPVTPATIADMKSLCLGLLEALNDKSLALIHQKKANKILASRITELEQRLDHGGKHQNHTFPSQILLQNYCSADVDQQKNDLLHQPECEMESKMIIIQQEQILKNTSTTTTQLPPQLQQLVDKALLQLSSEK